MKQIIELERAFTEWFTLLEKVNSLNDRQLLIKAALYTDLSVAEAKYRLLHKAVFPEDWEEIKRLKARLPSQASRDLATRIIGRIKDPNL